MTLNRTLGDLSLHCRGDSMRLSAGLERSIVLERHAQIHFPFSYD